MNIYVLDYMQRTASFMCIPYHHHSNPNEHHRPDTGSLPASKERNRFKGIVWDEYDPVHQKYLEIGRFTLLSSR